MGMKVLVTGSGGFIGSAIAKVMRDEGHHVISGRRFVGQVPESDVVACNLDQPDQVAAAVAGVDAVIHCAYGQERAMPSQCATLLAAMEVAKVKRVIYFSSIAVHGNGRGPIGTYATCKAACERQIQNWAADGEKRAIILRPGIVYGVGSELWIDKLAKRIRAGVWGDFGTTAEGKALLLHIDDLTTVTAIALTELKNEGPSLELDVAGPEHPTWNGYFHALCEHISPNSLTRVRGARLLSIVWLGYVAKIWRRLGLPGAHRASLAPTFGELAMFARRVPFSATDVPEALNYTPKIGVREGLSRSFLPQDTRPDP